MLFLRSGRVDVERLSRRGDRVLDDRLTGVVGHGPSRPLLASWALDLYRRLLRLFVGEDLSDGGRQGRLSRVVVEVCQGLVGLLDWFGRLRPQNVHLVDLNCLCENLFTLFFRLSCFWLLKLTVERHDFRCSARSLLLMDTLFISLILRA